MRNADQTFVRAMQIILRSLKEFADFKRICGR